MLKTLKNQGFASLVEVIVTSIIFVLAAFGIFTVVSMLQPHGQEAARRLEAAYYARSVLDELRAEVDARIWDNAVSNLHPGQTYTRDFNYYRVTWLPTADPVLNIRDVSMNVYYLGP